MCEPLPKKHKRSFVEAWLSDDRYKNWIRKVPLNDSLFHCIVCNKKFSCNTRISKHTNSTCHKNNVKKIDFQTNNHAREENIKNNGFAKSRFRQQWLDIELFKPWLSEAKHDKKLSFCSFCETYITTKLSNIYQHAKSAKHTAIAKEKGTETNKSDEHATSDKSLLLFNNRKKAAEIRYAAFIAEKNISYQMAKEILIFFQQIGKDSHIVGSMSMGRRKCQKIISNVLCPVETNRVVDIIKNTKFTILIDETSYISTEKWMAFLVRYVDPETLDTHSQLVKLIDIDPKNDSSDKLFDAFEKEMWSMQIPFSNIIAMSCNNAFAIMDKYSSFKTKLRRACQNLLTFSCPCHSVALIAYNACDKIPDYCEEFIKKVANYTHSNSKRLTIFEEFAESYQKTNRKILKLSNTRWLSQLSIIEKLLQHWNALLSSLEEPGVNEKTKSREYLLTLMQKPDVKAYLLFLKYILYYFNSFNAFFQSLETRIQLLQPKSLQLLTTICKQFLKPELLRSLKDIQMLEFYKKENQRSINKVHLGMECEKYLAELIAEGRTDVVANVRKDCLQFYVTAAEDICKRLPVHNAFLEKLEVFECDMALCHSNRKTSFYDVSFIAATFGDFDDNFDDNLKKEWFALYTDFTEAEKDFLATLSFDELWKEIFQRHQYPNLKYLLNAIRSLPNSNADFQRIFSFLPDLKTKKRNKLAPVNVNALCVLKSALQARRETVVDIEINEKHLSLMSTEKLYSSCSKKQNNHVTLHDADVNDIAGPSSSNNML